MSWLFTYRALDQQLTLRIDSELFLPLARDLHSSVCIHSLPCAPDHPAHLVWQPDSPETARILLRGEFWADGLNLPNLYLQSENLLTQLFLSALPHHLQLHASAVTDPQGRAILICGDSRAGKTSLALSLALAGWSILSDEAILIPSVNSPHVLGLRRNFNLKSESFPFFPELDRIPYRELYSSPRKMLVRFFNPTTASCTFVESAQLAALLFPKFVENLQHPEFHPLTPLETTQKLITQTILWQPWAPQWLATTTRLPAFEVLYSNPRGLSPESISPCLD